MDEVSAFEVLGLPPTASARDIEREAQKRLALISAGLAEDCGEDAAHRIRWAASALRDPRRRLAQEVLSRSLRTSEIPPASLAEALDDLEAALATSLARGPALAEEILWRELPPLGPYRAPEAHAEEERRALGAAPRAEPASWLEELDWPELVTHLPRKREVGR
jgi:hypothetical protein